MQGLEILRARHLKSPNAVSDTLKAPAGNLHRIDFTRYRSIVTTGIGSSSAHARYLAWLLRTFGGQPSWDVSTGAFLAPPPAEAHEQALVVFSQGLSPNARFALTFAGRFGCTVLVTAAGAEHGERADALKRAADAGVIVLPIPVDPEYEVLLRILGPLAGYAMALRLASRSKSRIEFDPDSIATAMEAASHRAESLIAQAGAGLFNDPITLLGTRGYSYLISNLCAKVSEGMFLPQPAALDALEFAHGYLQEATGKPRTFIALSCGSEPDTQLFREVQGTLEPQHRWLQFESTLPEPLQIFEYESAMNTLVLSAIAARHLDQLNWPGKGRDRSLYAIASIDDLQHSHSKPEAPPQKLGRRLADLTWPEVELLVGNGIQTVVIPLGATEQHGPHLPLRIDSLIADAVAERFCRRVPASIQAPVVDLGCSSEHMDFPGTLSLTASTLGAILEDLTVSFVRHGFSHIVVFSAHGGNDRALAELEPALKKSASPARVTIVHGIDALGKVWADASAQESIPAEVSGAHAGEFETSIIAALRPDLIRWSRMSAGLLELPGDPQTLFYPSLRKHAPDGVVGDPRLASAGRAERYLEAWVDFLISAYEETERAAAAR